MQFTELKRTASSTTGGLFYSQYHSGNGFIAIPDASVPVPANGFPVLVFFHGRGGASSTFDISKLYSETSIAAQIKNNQFQRDFIVVALQAEYATPTPAQMAYILQNKIFTQYNADESRVYATGLSFGGGAALAMALHYPDLIAGVVSASPSSLSTNPNSYSQGVTEEQALEKIAQAGIPVAFWVGMNDGADGYVQRVAAYYDRLFAAGTTDYQNNKLFKFNKASTGHGPWSNLYYGVDLIAAGKNMYDFLLQFSKGTTQQPPVEPEEPEEPETPAVTLKKTITIKVYSDGSYTNTEA